jgi:hypothetical protein
MKDQAQIIAIAKLQGFSEIIFRGIRLPQEWDYTGELENLKGYSITIPHYLSDLNVWHDIENNLEMSKARQSSYWIELHDLVYGEKVDNYNWQDLRAVGHATARQKAEAYLKSMDKWRDK